MTRFSCENTYVIRRKSEDFEYRSERMDKNWKDDNMIGQDTIDELRAKMGFSAEEISDEKVREIIEKRMLEQYQLVAAVEDWIKSKKYILACVLATILYESAKEMGGDATAVEEELSMRFIRLTLADKAARQKVADGTILVNVPFIKIGTENMLGVLEASMKINPDLKPAEKLTNLMEDLIMFVTNGMDDDDRYEMGTILAQIDEIINT